jgi:hypothetical protein
MSSNDRMMKLDMKSLMSEVNTVIERHVHAAVMDFNTSRFNEDISKCSDKIQQLEEDLMCVTKDESTARTRIQETTYRINVSLIEQELVSYRDKLHEIQEEMAQLCQSKNDTQDTHDTYSTNNIVLSIDEVVTSTTTTTKSIENVPDVCKDVPSVEKTNNIMDDITTTSLLGDDIGGFLPDGEEEEEEEEEEGVFEIEIDGVSYYTTDEKNGTLYSIDVNGDPDVYVGKLQNGKAVITDNGGYS